MKIFEPKIIVVSKGKPETALIYKWFEKHKFTNHVTVLSATDDRDLYEGNYGHTGGTYIKAHKRCLNLSMKREWVLKELCGNNQWAFMMVDSVLKVTGVKDANDLTRVGFSHEYSPQDLLKAVVTDIARADEIGAVLGGYASNDNHFFRQKRYRTVGFVWGGMMYAKNSPMEFDHNCNESDDYIHTATALKYSGRVLINNWLYLHNKRFQAIGGNGGYDQRVVGKKKTVQHLLTKYPGLYRIADRKGYAPDSEVRMCFSNEKQIALWRNNFKTSKYKTT